MNPPLALDSFGACRPAAAGHAGAKHRGESADLLAIPAPPQAATTSGRSQVTSVGRDWLLLLAPFEFARAGEFC
jgi:hypothetical protein